MIVNSLNYIKDNPRFFGAYKRKICYFPDNIENNLIKMLPNRIVNFYSVWLENKPFILWILDLKLRKVSGLHWCELFKWKVAFPFIKKQINNDFMKMTSFSLLFSIYCSSWIKYALFFFHRKLQFLEDFIIITIIILSSLIFAQMFIWNLNYYIFVNV